MGTADQLCKDFVSHLFLVIIIIIISMYYMYISMHNKMVMSEIRK